METEKLTIRNLKEVREMEDDLRTIYPPSLVIASTLAEVSQCIDSGYSYGIFEAKKLVAYVLCYKDDYHFSAFIEKTNTLPSHRGRGYNSKLMKAVTRAVRIDRLSFLVAMVSPANLNSIEAFKAAGFNQHKKLYYQQEKRLLMTKQLLW